MTKLTQLCLGAAVALGVAVPAFADGAATTTAPAAAPAPAASNVTADTVVATVNGTKITIGDMIAMRDQLPPQYLQLPDDVLFKGILDQLIQQTTLEQSVSSKLSKKDTLQLENTKRAFMANVALTAVTDAAVTDDALQKAYDAKYAAMDAGLEYHAAHILVQTEAEAKAIKAKLDAGGDFAQLAKENSKDGSAAQGGDLGWFGKGVMLPEFEKAVFSLKEGQTSGIVKTKFGYHIIKLTGTRKAGIMPFDEVKDQIRAALLPAKQQELFQKIKDDVKKGAKITINEDALKELGQNGAEPAEAPAK